MPEYGGVTFGMGGSWLEMCRRPERLLLAWVAFEIGLGGW